MTRILCIGGQPKWKRVLPQTISSHVDPAWRPTTGIDDRERKDNLCADKAMSAEQKTLPGMCKCLICSHDIVKLWQLQTVNGAQIYRPLYCRSMLSILSHAKIFYSMACDCTRTLGLLAYGAMINVCRTSSASSCLLPCLSFRHKL